MSILKSLVLSLLLLTTTAFAQSQPVWIDVRTVEEFSTDHIEGDANIPLASSDVEKLAAEYGKDAEIMLYCRSGNRAGQAKALLEQAGFTHITNAGGITDVRKLRDLADSSNSPAQ